MFFFYYCFNDLNVLYFFISYFVFLGGFMVLSYIYGTLLIHLLPVNHFLSIDLKVFPT